MKKPKTKYTAGQALVAKTDVGPIKTGDDVIVVQVGKGAYNIPFYLVRNARGETAHIAEQNLAVQKELI